MRTAQIKLLVVLLALPMLAMPVAGHESGIIFGSMFDDRGHGFFDDDFFFFDDRHGGLFDNSGPGSFNSGRNGFFDDDFFFFDDRRFDDGFLVFDGFFLFDDRRNDNFFNGFVLLGDDDFFDDDDFFED